MFDAAYNGISNSVLWFVHHLLFDTPNQPRFDAAFRADWAAYVAYNEAFAAALAQECASGTRVLIQDYHLSLAPRLLRDRYPAARIAHFEHTPWAPPEYYQLLPDDVAVAILDGMLGADHAGFLAERWADAFLDCCEAVLGAQVTRDPPGRRPGQLPRPGDRRWRCTRWASTPRNCAPGAAQADVRGTRGGAAGAGPGQAADRPGGPHRAVQEHRARAGRLPRAACHAGRSGAAG